MTSSSLTCSGSLVYFQDEVYSAPLFSAMSFFNFLKINPLSLFSKQTMSDSRLSHSSADKKFAGDFASRIEQAFDNELKVFCTSRPEDRLGQGGEIGVEAPKDGQIDLELIRLYLQRNLADCQLHLLLATGNSLVRGNDWVSYEMQLAAEEHSAPVVVLIGGIQTYFEGTDDPRFGWDTGGLDREELVKRSKWLAGSALSLLLDSIGCRTLIRQVIPKYLGLTASKPELVEDFEGLPW